MEIYKETLINGKKTKIKEIAYLMTLLHVCR